MGGVGEKNKGLVVQPQIIRFVLKFKVTVIFRPKLSESVLVKFSNVIPAKADIRIVEFTSWIPAFAWPSPK
jgi:hypothetical protein